MNTELKPHTKDTLEVLFGKLGLKPSLREKHGDYDVFYGDGFSAAPHLKWQDRGETKAGDYPLGAFVTFWWIGKDERLLIGRPLFFDITELSVATRINTARKDALAHLGKLKNAKPS